MYYKLFKFICNIISHMFYILHILFFTMVKYIPDDKFLSISNLSPIDVIKAVGIDKRFEQTPLTNKMQSYIDIFYKTGELEDNTISVDMKDIKKIAGMLSLEFIYVCYQNHGKSTDIKKIFDSILIFIDENKTVKTETYENNSSNKKENQILFDVLEL